MKVSIQNRQINIIGMTQSIERRKKTTPKAPVCKINNKKEEPILYWVLSFIKIIIKFGIIKTSVIGKCFE